ncbi:HTH domain-containing protein [Halalkalicoccus salilacus]|uniref:HTH domain-containing protein n=1 Tax=Halalkalicoccus salilacus TaxID=3117459 RepID=UPI00300EB6C3
MSADSVRVVLRLRTLGPAGLNPPQTEVLDHLQTLTEEGLIDELDVDVWGGAMGITHTEERDPVDIRETVAEYKQWADAHGCTLRPAFEWHSAESEGERRGQIVTPLITLAVYNGEDLQAVYPHIDEEVNTIHDGVKVLESMAETGGTEQPEDEPSDKRVVLTQ